MIIEWTKDESRKKLLSGFFMYHSGKMGLSMLKKSRSWYTRRPVNALSVCNGKVEYFQHMLLWGFVGGCVSLKVKSTAWHQPLRHHSKVWTNQAWCVNSLVCQWQHWSFHPLATLAYTSFVILVVLEMYGFETRALWTWG